MSMGEQYRRAWESGQQREAARRQQEARETAKNYARDRQARVAKEIAEEERIAKERAAAFAKDRAAWAKEEETRLKSAMRLGYLTTAGADDADEGSRLTTATGDPWG